MIRTLVPAKVGALVILVVAGCADDHRTAETTVAASTTTVASSQPAAGFPTVTRDADGAPIVSIPNAVPPATDQHTVLRQGDGTTVADGDVVTIDYQNVHWETGKVLHQTWGAAPEDFATTGGISSIRDAVIGQQVGSELLVVIPPVDGKEAHALPSLGVEDDDTFVFVIDVISTRPAS